MDTILSGLKVLGSPTACLFAVLLIMGTAGNEYSISGEQKDTGGKKTQEETLIEKTIIDIANASTQFPKTKDPKSILRFYSHDYAGINNGKPESVEDIAKYLSGVLEQLNLGAPLGISSKVTNIRTGVFGLLGWATYDSEYKLGSGGVVLQTTQGPCTTIFRKQGETWLIQHEHCSTASQVPLCQVTSISPSGDPCRNTVLSADYCLNILLLRLAGAKAYQRGRVFDWRMRTVFARRVCRCCSTIRVRSRECGAFQYN